MNFKLVSDVLKTLITTIQNTATAMVVSVKKHTFSVRVTNAVKNVTVKGTVTVGNQKKVEDKLKTITGAITKLQEITKDLPNKRYGVEVRNFPSEIEVSNLPIVTGEFAKQTKWLDKMVEEVQSLHKPLKELKQVEVTNHPTKELSSIIKELENVVKAVKQVELNPKITVSPASLPEVIVPPAQVTIQKQELDYKKLSEIFTVPEINYTKLAKVLSEEMGSLVITGGGGGGGRYAFNSSDGSRKQALVDSAGRVYLAEQNKTATLQYL
jgi:hypothetical protein